MIIDYEYKNKNLIVSYINDYGNIKLKYYNWPNPTKFVTCPENDPQRHEYFTTWDGRPVKEIYTRWPNKFAVYDFLNKLPEEERNEIFDYKEPNIFFVDIENEIVTEKVSPQTADGAIQAISIVNKSEVLVMGTKPMSTDDCDSIKYDINKYFVKYNLNCNFRYVCYKTEYDMLLNFFKLTSKMSVITGWNYVNYDNIYLINRARKLNIEPEMMSPTGLLRKNPDETKFDESPAHRLVVDYMELYEKWDTKVKVKESSGLDFVADKLLGLKKINYDGNLTMLYRDDYKKFIYYNAVDSILVQKIHEKMKYIDIMYGIATLSKIRTQDAFSALAVTEGILREKMREQKGIVFCKLDDKDGYIDPKTISESATKSIKGAWVKRPFKGMRSWVVCHDFASLYPTTIREFNLSADSFKGMLVPGQNYTIFNGKKLQLDPDDIITKTGAVFKNEMGVVNQVIGDVYADRKKYKKKMMATNLEIDALSHELEALEREVGDL